MFDYFMKPLGLILSYIYDFTHNYGLSIILFTIVVRAILLPLAIKQQKSMQEMQKIQPLLAEIQKKHKNDKEKLNQATLKLYQEHKVNPAGGCLPLLVQIPFMLALYQVIVRPFTFLVLVKSKLDMVQIKELIKVLTPAGKASYEITIIQDLKKFIVAGFNGIDGSKMTNHMIEAVKSATTAPVHKEQILQVLNTDAGIPQNIHNLSFHFLGMDLSNNPSIFQQHPQMWYMLLIPILAAGTTYLSSKLASMNQNTTGQNEQAAQMTKSMMNIFPIMTLMFTWNFPAGLGLYWIVSNLIQMIQQIFLNKFYGPVKTVNKEGV